MLPAIRIAAADSDSSISRFIVAPFRVLVADEFKLVLPWLSVFLPENFPKLFPDDRSQPKCLLRVPGSAADREFAASAGSTRAGCSVKFAVPAPSPRQSRCAATGLREARPDRSGR